MPARRLSPVTRSGIAAAVALLALTGCSSSGSGGEDPKSEPPVGDIPVLLDSKSLQFPLETYIPDATQRGTFGEAQDVLTDRCMKRYGYRYTVRSRGTERGDNATRYGVSSAVSAARYGYSNPELAESRPKPAQKALGTNEKLILHGEDKVDPSKAVPMSQEEAEKSDKGATTVAGKKVPAGGCVREGFLKLYAPTEESVDIMVPQNFAFDANGRSRQDSRVAKAVKAWSACMAEQGYRTDDPVSPQSDLGFGDTSLTTPKAVAAARQDVACKKETNLVGIWYAVEKAYQKRIIDQNAETLETVKKQLEERLRLAAELTS
ncbi:hypothetical protein [Streptomyces sp. NPDC057287]|uniref:hypothetical protein n=1 Tax=Streptomyces sp. NPDC057287 TaxID=3346086 RepID=UPI00362765C0